MKDSPTHHGEAARARGRMGWGVGLGGAWGPQILTPSHTPSHATHAPQTTTTTSSMKRPGRHRPQALPLSCLLLLFVSLSLLLLAPAPAVANGTFISLSSPLPLPILLPTPPTPPVSTPSDAAGSGSCPAGEAGAADKQGGDCGCQVPSRGTAVAASPQGKEGSKDASASAGSDDDMAFIKGTARQGEKERGRDLGVCVQRRPQMPQTHFLTPPPLTHASSHTQVAPSSWAWNTPSSHGYVHAIHPPTHPPTRIHLLTRPPTQINRTAKDPGVPCGSPPFTSTSTRYVCFPPIHPLPSLLHPPTHPPPHYR